MADTFVVSDIHGHYGALWALLNQEELVDDNAQLTDLGHATTIVQIGDLLNAVFKDIVGDEKCAHEAKNWFDFVLVGNHEWPYLFNTASFGGYYEHPPLRSLYNQWKREGFVRASFALGDTLITHAGWAAWPYPDEGDVAAEWAPPDAATAHSIITAAFERYPDTEDHLLLDMISQRRGGLAPIGGILWSDWGEEKVKNFNQVVGHTPSRKHHPERREYDNGKWSLCIDSGAKSPGGLPSGVWLDPEGEIIKVVSLINKEEMNEVV